jgi:hypothetical protein
MGVIALEIVAIWSLVAVALGLALGAVIRKGERVHTDEFLTAVFSTLESLQAASR